MSVKTKSYLEGEKKEKKSMPKQEIKEKNENEPPPPHFFTYSQVLKSMYTIWKF